VLKRQHISQNVLQSVKVKVVQSIDADVKKFREWFDADWRKHVLPKLTRNAEQVIDTHCRNRLLVVIMKAANALQTKLGKIDTDTKFLGDGIKAELQEAYKATDDAQIYVGVAFVMSLVLTKQWMKTENGSWKYTAHELKEEARKAFRKMDELSLRKAPESRKSKLLMDADIIAELTQIEQGLFDRDSANPV
jgi:hypothetical protein